MKKIQSFGKITKCWCGRDLKRSDHEPRVKYDPLTGNPYIMITGDYKCPKFLKFFRHTHFVYRVDIDTDGVERLIGLIDFNG